MEISGNCEGIGIIDGDKDDDGTTGAKYAVDDGVGDSDDNANRAYSVLVESTGHDAIKQLEMPFSWVNNIL